MIPDQFWLDSNCSKQTNSEEKNSITRKLIRITRLILVQFDPSFTFTHPYYLDEYELSAYLGYQFQHGPKLTLDEYSLPIAIAR